MAINFPDAPIVGQTHTVGSTVWTWNGVSWNTGTASGPLGTAGIADKAVTYPKIQDISATSRVLGRKTAGAGIVEELTAADLNAMGVGGGFAAGTKLVAAQTTAPTGWTKDVTHNNKAVRVVSGTVGSGGLTAFSTVFASRTPSGSISSNSFSAAQLAVHDHGYDTYSGTNTPSTNGAAVPGSSFSAAKTVTSTGSGSTHGHTFTGSALDFDVQYVDVTIITKD